MSLSWISETGLSKLSCNIIDQYFRDEDTYYLDFKADTCPYDFSSESILILDIPKGLNFYNTKAMIDIRTILGNGTYLGLFKKSKNTLFLYDYARIWTMKEAINSLMAEVYNGTFDYLQVARRNRKFIKGLYTMDVPDKNTIANLNKDINTFNVKYEELINFINNDSYDWSS